MSCLYISDLDGTLLTNEPRLSEFSESTLRELLGAGLPFSVASARSVVSMRRLLRNLPITLPVIELNGAFVSNLATGEHEIVNALDSGVASDAYEEVLRLGHAPFVSTFNGHEDCLYVCDIANGGMRWYLDDRIASRDPRLRSTANLGQVLSDQVVCITIINGREALVELELVLREKCGTHVEMHLFENQYSPGWYWLTVHDWRAKKDKGVQAMMELCGLSDRSLVAFGNDSNDICLFELAAERVAVANAFPELKRYATHVIGSNEDESVARYLREHWDTVGLVAGTGDAC